MYYLRYISIKDDDDDDDDENSFSYERLCTKTRFEKRGPGQRRNSQLDSVNLAILCIVLTVLENYQTLSWLTMDKLKTLCRLQCNARVCLCFDSFGERTL